MPRLQLTEQEVTSTSKPGCNKCGKAAVVRVEYAKLDLCKDCFCARFEDRVGLLNRRFRLLRRGDKIAVAVSGGKDSACLLLVLHKLAAKIGEITLMPILIDEGIEGYRNVAAQNAKDLCLTLGLPLTVFSYKELYGAAMDDVVVARDSLTSGHKRLNSCGYCGVFRKQALNKAARDLGANKIAIGHNADDTAQSLLMNLMNNQFERIAQNQVAHTLKEGSMLVPRIKPLILNPEIECALYATLNNAPYHRGGCPYANEAFRGTVKDFLNVAEQEHPGVKLNLVDAALRLEEKETGGECHANIVECVECGEPVNGKQGAICRACTLIFGLGFKHQAAQSG